MPVMSHKGFIKCCCSHFLWYVYVAIRLWNRGLREIPKPFRAFLKSLVSQTYCNIHSERVNECLYHFGLKAIFNFLHIVWTNLLWERSVNRSPSTFPGTHSSLAESTARWEAEEVAKFDSALIFQHAMSYAIIAKSLTANSDQNTI